VKYVPDIGVKKMEECPSVLLLICKIAGVFHEGIAGNSEGEFPHV
jgi:hypothetical protein